MAGPVLNAEVTGIENIAAAALGEWGAGGEALGWSCFRICIGMQRLPGSCVFFLSSYHSVHYVLCVCSAQERREKERVPV